MTVTRSLARPVPGILAAGCALALAVLVAGPAAATPEGPSAFVLNNVGGTVTPVTFDGDGVPTALPPVPSGAWPQSASLSPDGRWLAVAHATESDTTELLLVYEVGPDGSLTEVADAQVPDSPLDCAWLTDELLAVSRSSFGGTNEVRTYRWDADAFAILPGDAANAGTFHTSLAVHPTLPIVYGQDSLGFTIRWWTWDAAGDLTPAGSISTGSVYPLDVTIDAGGTTLYAAGGISSGGDKLVGFAVDAAGDLSPLTGSPYVSPGASPAHVAIPAPGALVAIGHGTDATVRTFDRDPATGALSPTGFSFDVGLQGSIGDVVPLGERVLVTDETTALDGIAGLYVFDVAADGTLVATAPILPTGGTRPETIVAWTGEGSGPVGPDVNGDGVVDLDDLLAVLAAFGTADPGADVDGSGTVDLEDLLAVLGGWTG